MNAYKTEEEVIEDALRHLMRSRPDLRIQVAVHYYQTLGISLARAAQIAGVSWAQMKELLHQKGVSIGLGPENVEEVTQDVDALESFLDKKI
jgi:predicted HTH domain antitoxin